MAFRETATIGELLLYLDALACHHALLPDSTMKLYPAEIEAREEEGDDKETYATPTEGVHHRALVDEGD
jgi:hypothetical protein